MTPDEAVVAVIDALERSHVPYMIVGSLASNFHGIPRSTQDADFVVELEPQTLGLIGDALPAGLCLQTQGSFETVTGALRYIIELDGSPFVCELFVRSDDPHDRERFGRRLRTLVLDRRVSIASAEDMIVTKLRWALLAGRGKDLDDARNMIAVRDRELDWDHITRWSVEHRTRALLDQVRASIPPD